MKNFFYIVAFIFLLKPHFLMAQLSGPSNSTHKSKYLLRSSIKEKGLKLKGIEKNKKILAKSKKIIQYSWKDCEQKIFAGHTLPFDQFGNFIPECAPDTLYSWKKEFFIDLMAKNSTPTN